MNAGSRNRSPVRYRRYFSVLAPMGTGGAATGGGSAVTPPTVTLLLGLLVRLRGGRLQLLCDPLHVLGVLEEVLEQAPLALAGGRAERGRLVVGHVEHNRLRLLHRHGGRARDRVGEHTRAHVVVARRESARLRPRGGGLRGGEERLECGDGRIRAERDDQ